MSEDAYARKEGFPTKIVMTVLAGIVLVLWFVFGQGYFSSPPAENPVPPTMWLVYEGQLYSGVRGSYCWATVCVDSALQEPTGIVNISQGSFVELFMNSRISPDIVNASVLTVDDLGNLTQIGELANEGNYKYKVNLQHGTYTLKVQANWQDLGDINYIFKIRVE